MDDDLSWFVSACKANPPEMVMKFLIGDVRTFLTSVNGWATLISSRADISTIKVTDDVTVGDGMANLLNQMNSLLHELSIAADYAATYKREDINPQSQE